MSFLRRQESSFSKAYWMPVFAGMTVIEERVKLMRVSLQSGFILHHRPYRETSVLLDVFSEQYGRIGLVARGVRAARSTLRAVLQPFIPLLLSWQGKTELMTLVSAEVDPINNINCSVLQGHCLFGGFYLNELLMRVLPKQDSHLPLYTIYQNTLLELRQSNGNLQEKVLRLFEKKLLQELGYGLQCQDEMRADSYYQFHAEKGFILTDSNNPAGFKGESLLAFSYEEWHTEEQLRDAKRLMRLVLGSLFDLQSLQSRKLFI